VFGFLIHLLMLDSFPSRSVGLYWAAFAGGLAVLYFLVTLKGARFIPVEGLLQAGLFNSPPKNLMPPTSASGFQSAAD
jgi:hypothetical protein